MTFRGVKLSNEASKQATQSTCVRAEQLPAMRGRRRAEVWNGFDAPRSSLGQTALSSRSTHEPGRMRAQLSWHKFRQGMPELESKRAWPQMTNGWSGGLFVVVWKDMLKWEDERCRYRCDFKIFNYSIFFFPLISVLKLEFNDLTVPSLNLKRRNEKYTFLLEAEQYLTKKGHELVPTLFAKQTKAKKNRQKRKVK